MTSYYSLRNVSSERRLVVGEAYEYDGWLFVVVAVRDEWSVSALCLTDFGSRFKAGEVTEVRHNSAVGQYARRVE